MKDNIRVLHLVSGNLNEGAARGAYWLHNGLIKNGVESRILCNSRDISQYNFTATTIKSNKDIFIKKINSLIDGFPKKLYLKADRRIFSTGIAGLDITNHYLYDWANIINLHWINDGFINIKHLNNIKKPIVWTLRDMWPMTGGCHYAMDCQRYKTGCGNCIQLKSIKKNDLSSYVLKRKEQYIPKNVKLIGISNWLSQEAENSKIFCNFDIETIQNNINTNNFKFLDKDMARKKLKITTNKKIILCGSKSIKDFYKGFDKFIEALNFLNNEKYFLCFFGHFDNSLANGLTFEYKKFGYIDDDNILNNLYSSADVFVSPSRMEAFGKTIAEAMSSGTPAVCFNATGPKDIVTHMNDGYKAKPFDSYDLAKGIDWICENKNYNDLRQNARNKILNKFDIKVVAKKYIDLYDGLIN